MEIYEIFNLALFATTISTCLVTTAYFYLKKENSKLSKFVLAAETFLDISGSLVLVENTESFRKIDLNSYAHEGDGYYHHKARSMLEVTKGINSIKAELEALKLAKTTPPQEMADLIMAQTFKETTMRIAMLLEKMADEFSSSELERAAEVIHELKPMPQPIRQQS